MLPGDKVAEIVVAQISLHFPNTTQLDARIVFLANSLSGAAYTVVEVAMVELRGYDHAQLRGMVERFIAQNPATQVEAVAGYIANQAENRDAERRGAPGNYVNAQLADADYGRVRDIIWDLIVEGIVRPGLLTRTESDLPWFHVTEKGRAALGR